MNSADKADAIVIGSGIIGAMSAFYLRADGHSVTLIERGEIAGGASRGNAGILAFAEIIPIAAPGVMKKAPKWLLDPLGPLSLPPGYALQIAPWLWRFWRAGALPAFRHGIKVQAAMMGLAQTEMQHVLAHTSLGHIVGNTGTLDLYDSEQGLKAAASDWREKARAGVGLDMIGRGDIDRLQPGLAGQFRHGISTPAGLQVAGPQDFTRAIIDHTVSQGTARGSCWPTARCCRRKPLSLQPERGRRRWQKASATTRRSKRNAVTTRRCHETPFRCNANSISNDHGFVVTPLSTGIRIGGAVELGGLKMEPDYRRSEAMLKKAKSFLPDPNAEGGRQWMGFRPSMPDSIPVIGTSKATSAVIYAFGHGHLGLTQSAFTGRLVSDIVARRNPAIAIDPFRIGRFS
jgi:D-amino-acid dehydrogenase